MGVLAVLMLLGCRPVADARLVGGPAASSIAGRDSYRVLVFTKTAGFRHASIPDGVAAIRRLGAEHGFAVDQTADAGRFTDAGLRPYSAVLWLSTTGNLLTAGQRAAFERYIRGGGGYVGVHAAADAEYGWAWYAGLVGAVFRSHPPVQRATVRVTDPRHPATASLPPRLTWVDEWYDFRAGVSPRVHVLATDGPTTYPDGHHGGDHPVVWCQNYGGGRSFYVAPGHTSAIWRDAAYLQIVLGGIQSAAGARAADCAASSPPATTHRTNGRTPVALLVLGALGVVAAVGTAAGAALRGRRRRRRREARDMTTSGRVLSGSPLRVRLALTRGGKMTTTDATAEEHRCSFCGRAHTEVAKLVAGPGVYICNECVDLAESIIEQYREPAADLRLPTWNSLSDEQMLDRIPRVAAVASQVEANLRSWVQELRRRNVTWAKIGEALGITRQSAWERFSGEE